MLNLLLFRVLCCSSSIYFTMSLPTPTTCLLQAHMPSVISLCYFWGGFSACSLRSPCCRCLLRVPVLMSEAYAWRPEMIAGACCHWQPWTHWTYIQSRNDRWDMFCIGIQSSSVTHLTASQNNVIASCFSATNNIFAWLGIVLMVQSTQ